MEPLWQIAVSALTLAAAAVVAIWIGGRRGLQDVEMRADVETTRLVAALDGQVQALRADLLASRAESASLRAEIASLRAEVVALKAELHTERRITARLTENLKGDDV